MNSKECKKCHRSLPESYKYKYCECCRNEQADNVKKVTAVLIAVGVGANGIFRKLFKK